MTHLSPLFLHMWHPTRQFRERDYSQTQTHKTRPMFSLQLNDNMLHPLHLPSKFLSAHTPLVDIPKKFTGSKRSHPTTINICSLETVTILY